MWPFSTFKIEFNKFNVIKYIGEKSHISDNFLLFLNYKTSET